MDTNQDAFSRTDGVLKNLGASATDAHRFPDKVVLITGEPNVLNTANGRLCLLASIRLIPRMCRHVYLCIPPSCHALREEAIAVAREIEFSEPIVVVDEQPVDLAFDAVLNVGLYVPPSRAWTAVSANGWVAWTSSVTPLPAMAAPTTTNAIASLFAACMAASDVFKRLAGMVSDRGPLFDRLAFSLLTLKVGDTDPGPALPDRIDLPPTWLVGLGAIGNGVVFLFEELLIHGDIWSVDKQQWGTENRNTYIMLHGTGEPTWKAEWVAGRLNRTGRLRATPLRGEIAEVRKQIGNGIPLPGVVLAGLDNPDGRRHAQSIWPDLFIDGATGDLEAQAVAYAWGHPGACIKCQFPATPGFDSTKLSAAITGLAAERIFAPDAVVTDQDVANAPVDRREELKQHVGKRICAVVSEYQIKRFTNGQLNFSPSVPFVSCASAALMVAALVKHLMGLADKDCSKYYFDALQGPANGVMLKPVAGPRCDCQLRAETINRWRQSLAPSQS